MQGARAASQFEISVASYRWWRVKPPLPALDIVTGLSYQSVRMVADGQSGPADRI